MPEYLLRLFDPREKIARIVAHEFCDDLEALDAAEALAQSCVVEVWGKHGRIARLKVHDEPALPSDPVSG
jgi:hypothetical protein